MKKNKIQMFETQKTSNDFEPKIVEPTTISKWKLDLERSNVFENSIVIKPKEDGRRSPCRIRLVGKINPDKEI